MRSNQPWPIAANPGGPVDPDDHIGHETEFEEVLRSVAEVGALLLGDRRMGKTSLLRKVERSLVGEHVVLRLSAETDDLALFGGRLLDLLRNHSRFAEELRRWNIEVDVSYRGIHLKRRGDGGAMAPEDGDDLFRWAAEKALPAKLVLILDEIAVLARAIEQQQPGGAIEFLRSLRRPRQEVDNLAMVLSGSTGLHHAVRDNAPINDLHKIRVGPLDHFDAVFLARCLILGEEVTVSDETAVAEAMASASDGVPYYIHHLARSARRAGRVIEPADIRTLRDDALADPDDPWNLRHYRERLADYYGDRHALAAHALDVYASADQPLTLAGLQSALQAVDLEARPNRDELLRLVEQLEADHYLRRTGQSDAIASTLLRDAWRNLRRL